MHLDAAQSAVLLAGPRALRDCRSRPPTTLARPCAVMRLCVTKIGVAVMVRSVKEGAEAFCFRQAL